MESRGFDSLRRETRVGPGGVGKISLEKDLREKRFYDFLGLFGLVFFLCSSVMGRTWVFSSWGEFVLNRLFQKKF